APVCRPGLGPSRRDSELRPAVARRALGNDGVLQGCARDTPRVTDRSGGWQALSRGRWGEALESFHGGENDPDALEGIGVAQWWLDDADATLAARERAYRLYRAAGDRVGAARVASALAWDSVLFGGGRAGAQGGARTG